MRSPASRIATESKPSPAMVITVASMKLALVQRWTAVFPEISSSASPENVLAPIQKTTAPAMNRPAARRSESTPMPAGAGSRTQARSVQSALQGAEENGNGKGSEDYFTTMGTGLDVDAPRDRHRADPVTARIQVLRKEGSLHGSRTVNALRPCGSSRQNGRTQGGFVVTAVSTSS
jgi:hypothetical protein